MYIESAFNNRLLQISLDYLPHCVTGLGPNETNKLVHVHRITVKQ